MSLKTSGVSSSQVPYVAIENMRLVPLKFLKIENVQL